MKNQNRTRALQLGSIVILSAFVALFCAAGAHLLPDLSALAGNMPLDAAAVGAFTLPGIAAGFRCGPFLDPPTGGGSGGGGTATLPAPGAAGNLTDPAFREVTLAAVRELDNRTKTAATELAEFKELRTKAEAAFKDLDAQKELTGKQAKTILDLQRSLLSAQRGIDPNEPPTEHLKRAFPDECRALGEAVLKGNGKIPLADLLQRAESTTSAGAIVPQAFSDTVYSRVVNFGAFRALDVHPMSAKTENLIIETSEPSAVFVAENGTFPESTLGLSPVGATAKKIGVLIGISKELDQDAALDLGAYILTKFARAVAKRADYAAFMSDGTNDGGGLNGGFTGIFNAGTLVTAGAATTIGALTLEDVLAVIGSVGQAVIENGPKWFVNPMMLPQFLGIRDANGRPLFLNALEAPAYGSIGTILGFPVVPVAVAPSTNAAASKVAAFGDPQAYSVGIRLDYQFEYSDHARFEAYQRVYRGLMRAAFMMKNAANIAVLKTHA